MANDKGNGFSCSHVGVSSNERALKPYFPILLTLSYLINLNMEGLPQHLFFKNVDFNFLYTYHTRIK